MTKAFVEAGAAGGRSLGRESFLIVLTASLQQWDCARMRPELNMLGLRLSLIALSDEMQKVKVEKASSTLNLTSSNSIIGGYTDFTGRARQN